jgi:subtilisin family serine protease
MVRLRLGLLVSALLALCLASAALADTSKLNSLARVSLAKLRTPGGFAAIPGAPEARLTSATASGELDVIIIGDVSRAQLEAAGARVRTALPGIFTAYIPEGSVETVAALSGVQRIEGSVLCEPNLDASVPTTNASNLRGAGPNFTGLNGAGVIVGVCDTGVDYHHGDFDDPGGNTRLLNIWDQNSAGVPPGGFGYGAEWNSVQIDANTSTQKDLQGHGSHVMGIAGGDGSLTGGATPAHTYVGMAPKADLIMVNTTFFTSGILDGVQYIFNRATTLGQDAVVNLSLGSHFGPHDGTSGFEAGLTALTGAGRIVVNSAGNEGNSARHAEIFATVGGANATMSVTNSTPGHVIAIDGYYEATENMNITVTTPGGTVIGPITVGNANAAYPGPPTPNGHVYVENGLSLTSTLDKEVYIEINVLAGQSAFGTWTIKATAVALGAANGELDMWRFFNNFASAFFVLGVDNEELLSEPANANQIITVASYVTKSFWTDCNGFFGVNIGSPPPGNISGFSSIGPTRDGRQKPEIAAPGEVIGSVLNRFDVATICPGVASFFLNDGLNHRINVGTSMAAPHVAGAVALFLQKNPGSTPAQATTFLQTRAIVDGFTGAVWNKFWGTGKLWLGDMIDPTVAVTAPNGGEVHFGGANVNLTWTANDNTGVTSVDLELSRNGGTTWETIALSQPNTGTYNWVATLPQTTQARLRVTASDAAGNTGSDISDANWSIIDQATPTRLAVFDSETLEEGVRLRWQFSDPEDIMNTLIERSIGLDGSFAVHQMEMSSENGMQYALDRAVTAGETYYYRLVVTSRDGERTMFGPLAGVSRASITEFALSTIAPNPTNGVARIDFALPREADVSLKILDIQGRVVADLASGLHQAGRYQATWSGDSQRGRVPAGLYFVQFSTPTQQFTKRLVVAR